MIFPPKVGYVNPQGKFDEFPTGDLDRTWYMAAKMAVVFCEALLSTQTQTWWVQGV